MALEYKNFNNISAKNLTLPDNNIVLKGQYIQAGSFEYTGYEILKDVCDVKTNNFSNIALSKKQKNSNVLKIKEVGASVDTSNIVTTLSFYGNDEDNSIWLCFNKSYDTWDMDISEAVVALTKARPAIYGNYLFRVELFEDNSCKISHNFADYTYYLEYNNGFKYTTKRDAKTTVFRYHLDENIIRLYVSTFDGLKRIICKQFSEDSYELALGDYKSDADGSDDDNIYILSDNEKLDYQIENSWVVYDRRNKIDVINASRSAFDLDGQFLVHHEYHTDNDINIIPLKNNLTYQGSLVNGNNLVKTTDGFYNENPAVDFKTYTGLHSGINQEYGNGNIILTFNFTDQEYHVEAGEEYEFTIPEDDNTNITALYPYKSLNINDSAFVKNGAFGSDTPYFADKFKKLQNENTIFNNGTYLCTWLYQPNNNSIPVWLDRYYYPDMIHRNKALTLDTYKPSFNNIPDNIYDKKNIEENQYNNYIKEDIDNFKLALQNNTYVDKKSDVSIEAGTTYKYQRIGKSEVNAIINEISGNSISVVKDQNSNNVNLFNEFAFNRENWRRITADNFKNTSAINFNTNLYINPYKKMGIQIFGSDYNNGVNIQNRKDLAPFHYYTTPTAVHLLNNEYSIRQSCNIFEKYNTKIKASIIGEVFDDLYVLTDDSIIIMEYDLKLKSRILYDDIADIYNVTKATKSDIGNILSRYQPLQYNGNLYIPINRIDDCYIIKLIFNPDKNDETLLSARRLASDEFVNNFTNTYDETLVETESIIKSLYVDNEGIIYAFNYDKLKMSYDGDTIYGLYNSNKENTDNWYYIFNQSVGRLHSSAAASKYAEFSSDVSIDNIAINPRGEMALIRGFRNNATLKKIVEEEKCLEIYNRSKTKIYNYPLRDFTSVVALDYYSYIDDAFEEHMAFSVIGVKLGQIAVVEYQSEKEAVRIHYTGINADFIDNFYQATNSNKLIDRYDENKIYFNLFLPQGIHNKKLSIEWDLKEAQEGWYNINFEVDMDKAIFQIKINDELFGKIDHQSVDDFYRFSHSNDSIFDSTYYFGVIGKDHGTTLHEILSDSLYDPYVLQNTKTENTTLYNRSLKYHEYQAMRLIYSDINPLTITLPCGVRNGIEEIVRYFKYRTPGFITNKVKINISGLSDIKYESEMNALKKEILTALKENGDCLTKVNEIEFI